MSDGYSYHQEQEIVLIKRAMMRAAGRSVLMVDHTKFGRVALHRVAPLSDWDLVLTDDQAPEEALADMREHDVRFEIV